MLPKSGQTIPRVCTNGMGSLHKINKLEAVQRHVVRSVTGNYHTTSSVSDMTTDLGLEALQQRRIQAKLVMMYRITHVLIDSPATQLPDPAELSIRSHSMRYLIIFLQDRCIPVLLLPIRSTLVEPATGVHRNITYLGDLQRRTAWSLLGSQKRFYPF